MAINSTTEWRNLPLPNQQLLRNLSKIMASLEIRNASEIARMCGLSRDNIHRYKKGANVPTLETLDKLAQGLRVHPSDLIPCLFDGTYTKEPTLSRNPRGPTSKTRPDVFVQTDPKDPTKAIVRINKSISLETAAAVARLINEAEVTDDAPDRAASR